MPVGLQFEERSLWDEVNRVADPQLSLQHSFCTQSSCMLVMRNGAHCRA